MPPHHAVPAASAIERGASRSRRRSLRSLALAAGVVAGCADSAPIAESVSAPVPDPPAVRLSPPIADLTPDPVVPRFPEEPPLPPADRLAAAGLATVGGGDFVVVTDVSDAAADLPDLMDGVRPAWDAYLGEIGGDVPMTAFLMAEPDRFRIAGLLPDDLPPFLTGRQRGRRFWMYEPDGDYFRRALTLHEATHVRMTAGLPVRGKGPLWYLEGMAELIGAHRLADDGTLTVRVIPGPEAAAGGWDRIERVRADVAAGYLPTIEDIRAFDDADFLEGRGYAWSWALCAFLDGHPAYGDRFRELANPGVRGRLDAAFDAAFADRPPPHRRGVAAVRLGTGAEPRAGTERRRLRPRETAEGGAGGADRRRPRVAVGGRVADGGGSGRGADGRSVQPRRRAEALGVDRGRDQLRLPPRPASRRIAGGGAGRPAG